MQPGVRHLGDAGEDVGQPNLRVDAVELGGAELPGIARRVLVYGGERSFRAGDGVEVQSTDRPQQALAERILWP